MLESHVAGLMETVVRFYSIARFESGKDSFNGESALYGVIGSGPLDITEAVTEADGKVLATLVSLVAHEGMIAVEIGSWKGFSTAIIGKAIEADHGQLFAVDHWQGNAGTANINEVAVRDIYAIFRYNMQSLNLWNVVHPLVCDSRIASRLVANDLVSFIFIDGDHRYEVVKDDIGLWLPKLSTGGIMCGHDFNDPRVRGAVDELLGGGYSVMANVWYYGVPMLE